MRSHGFARPLLFFTSTLSASPSASVDDLIRQPVPARSMACFPIGRLRRPAVDDINLRRYQGFSVRLLSEEVIDHDEL